MSLALTKTVLRRSNCPLLCLSLLRSGATRNIHGLSKVSHDKVLCDFWKRSPLLKFVLRRHFGRNLPFTKLGHGIRPQVRHKWVICFGTVFLMSWMIDWQYLKEHYGIWIPYYSDLFMVSNVDSRELIYRPSGEKLQRDTKSSAPQILEERKEEIYEYLLEQRLKEDALEENPEKARERDFVRMMRAKMNPKAEEANHHLSIHRDLSERKKEQEENFGATGSKKNVGFRNRKIIEYENRIRQYSTPDKIFRYFATFRVTDEKGHSEVMMSPEDFLRSITPGIQQPENLGLDQFNAVDTEELKRISPDLGVQEDSIFFKLGSGGLISFSDYMFLLTVLSTSRRHFEIAFKMFDLNGDGNVDAKEFEVVTNLMKSQSSMGARHRDHQTTGSTFKGINSGLITYFFGEDQQGILTVDKFLEFQHQLQTEILALEFRRHSQKSSKNDAEVISEKDFADLMIAYAGFSNNKRAKIMKRIKREFGSRDKGITLEDYLNFYQVLFAINDIDTALTFYHIAGAPIEHDTMKHVARTVSGVELSDHIIDVVFLLFDENNDGKLSKKEFVNVMKQRAMRGLEKPKDTGLSRILSAMTKCAADTRPTILGGSRKTE